jgi:hypothetical protein
VSFGWSLARAGGNAGRRERRHHRRPAAAAEPAEISCPASESSNHVMTSEAPTKKPSSFR